MSWIFTIFGQLYACFMVLVCKDWARTWASGRTLACISVLTIHWNLIFTTSTLYLDLCPSARSKMLYWKLKSKYFAILRSIRNTWGKTGHFDKRTLKCDTKTSTDSEFKSNHKKVRLLDLKVTKHFDNNLRNSINYKATHNT